MIEQGLSFCSAVMGTDLRHTPVVGGEEGYPDMIARPDLEHAGLAAVGAGRRRVPRRPRARAGRRARCPTRAARSAAPWRRCASSALDPIVGPELEFFLLERDADGARRRPPPRRQPEHGLHGRPAGRPGGLVRGMTEAWRQLGLGAFAVNHEFMNSQYEINLRHADALTAADRAFRLKSAVKDIAAQHGLVATFMGKPFNDQGGSGTHLHLSLERDGRNAFDAPGADRRPRATSCARSPPACSRTRRR